MYIKMDFTSVDRFDGEALHKMNRGMNTILIIENKRSIIWPLFVGLGYCILVAISFPM